MTRKSIAFILVLTFAGVQVIFAQGLSLSNDPGAAQNTLPDIHNKTEAEEEGVVRRAEITFLLSLPFTAIVSFLFMNGLYFISDPTYNFSMTNMPPEILPYSIFSAVFTSGIIAYADYRTVQGKKTKSTEAETLHEIREFQIVAGMKKKF